MLTPIAISHRSICPISTRLGLVGLVNLLVACGGGSESGGTGGKQTGGDGGSIAATGGTLDGSGGISTGGTISAGQSAGGALPQGGTQSSGSVTGGSLTGGIGSQGGAGSGSQKVGGASAPGGTGSGGLATGGVGGGAGSGGVAGQGGVAGSVPSTGGSPGGAIAYDMVVAQDGSGKYTKVQDAFNAVPDNKTTRTVIYVKAGTYKEVLVLKATKKNVTLIGESRDTTILTYDNYQKKTGTTNCSTLIEADDFRAENITFENTVDSRDPQFPQPSGNGGQATALQVMGDRNIFYKCKMAGFQDVFYLKTNKRTYIKESIIDGTMDFLLGQGIALFEKCTIRNRSASHITALNQAVGKNKYGFVFIDTEITTHPDETVTAGADLGRPWSGGARAVFINCLEGAHIKPEGWSVWESTSNHKTAYYAEYKCTGPGYRPESRLPWTYQLTDTEAAIYTKEQIFAANTTTAVKLEGDWNPVVP